MSKRPPGLVAIVCYKAFTATLFAITSISILLTLKNYQGLAHFADSLALEGKQGVIAWTVNKVLNVNPKTLQFSQLAAAAYAIVTLVEAVGLWYEKVWARWLVLGVVGISIPPEIFELIKGFSFLKLIVFVLNIGIFIYLVREFPQAKDKK